MKREPRTTSWGGARIAQRKVTSAAREHAAKLRDREARASAIAALPFDPRQAERLARGYHVARDAARNLWLALAPAAQVLIWDQLTLEGQAIIDPSIEAMLALWDRGEDVVPIGDNLWSYSAHGQSREISTRQLMQLAGTVEAVPF